MHRVFVYGTLKRGASNAAQMAGATWEGEARTRAGYGLYLLHGYPVLVAVGRGVVRGEVYRVSAEHLARLDAFEEVPVRYERARIELEDGSRAEAYVMTLAKVEGAEPIEGRAIARVELLLHERGSRRAARLGNGIPNPCARVRRFLGHGGPRLAFGGHGPFEPLHPEETPPHGSRLGRARRALLDRADRV